MTSAGTPPTIPARMTQRLAPQAGELIDRGRQLTFSWDGDRYPAYQGDTIISALAACGQRVFSRSFKYHRPRGLLTANFSDPGCLVQVDGEPNVRAAHRRVEPGMQVRSQNAWPSLRHDLGAVNQAISRLLPAGFYYKTFMAPRVLWPVYQRVFRRFAPGGKVPRSAAGGYYDKRYAHPDVLVAGGGPAGMAAAAAAAVAGARVLLVEEEYELGGHLRWGDAAQLARLAELRAAVAGAPSIEVLTNSAVIGRYDDNWVAVAQRDLPHARERLIKARADVLVVAPGLIERPYVFAGNDKPGVMLSTAVRRLINLYAVRPGERAVVLTANAEGDRAIADLERAGVQMAAVVDARRGEDVVAARGGGGLREVELAGGRVVEADLLVTAVGWTAPTALLNMAGVRPAYDPRAGRFFPRDLPDDLLAAGGIAGDGTLDQIIDHARAVGGEAARRARARDGRTTPPDPLPALPIDTAPSLFRSSTHGIVDYSEDVSSKDVVGAVREGFDSIELAKRFTTATMGPAQGKLELVNTVAVHAEATGRDIAGTGTTTWRPPYAPVSLGALAGRSFQPVAYSSLQPWHARQGAKPLVAGQWIRPDHYGDPAAEVRNVRENVGIIDVTPLGKFELRGPDVARLLNYLYVNKWMKLAVGSVRYGVMCGQDGVVLDDGVTGRLADDCYIMTTTSSGPETVWRWIENILQTEHPQWRIHVTPRTSALASINVAGPKARTLMQRLVDGIDLDPEAFPYMRVRSGAVAGIPGCFMWRIGFTGELSYEIHAPAAYGLQIWETLLAKGADLGVAPFGIEAQRIMRLEKGHFIVGQDTDGLTQAYAAGVGALVKLDKEDFIGKPELVWAAQRDDQQVLVGLQPADESIVPDEGCQLVEGERAIVGRITSSRLSPTLGRSICLGFVEPRLAAAGTMVDVRLVDGRRLPVRVMEHHAHYDPEGLRLRV